MGSKVLDPDGQRKDSFKTKISEPHKKNKVNQCPTRKTNEWRELTIKITLPAGIVLDFNLT